MTMKRQMKPASIDSWEKSVMRVRNARNKADLWTELLRMGDASLRYLAILPDVADHLARLHINQCFPRRAIRIDVVRNREESMKRTQEQAMHTRARILDSAVQAFLRQGLSHTSLADIAGVAGVTRGAVYGHFRNKSALFEAMLEHAGLPVDPFLIAWHAPEPDPLERLRRALVRHLARVLSKGVARRIYSIVYSRCEVSEETREFWEKMHAGRRAAEQRIADALADARAQGQLAASADIAQLAAFTHASLMGFFIRSLAEQASIAPRQSAEHVVDLAFLLLRPVEPAD